MKCGSHCVNYKFKEHSGFYIFISVCGITDFTYISMLNYGTVSELVFVRIVLKRVSVYADIFWTEGGITGTKR